MENARRRKVRHRPRVVEIDGSAGQVGIRKKVRHALESLVGEHTSADRQTPHEADGTTKFHELYEGPEFVDDVSGLFLNKELAIQARKLEIYFFKDREVYEKIPKEPWMHVI